MMSTLQTYQSLFGSLRCPISALFLPSLESSFSQFTSGSAFIVEGGSSIEVIESISELSTKHCTAQHELSTWANIAQQVLNYNTQNVRTM